jgi:hypothetical protein
LNRIESFAFAWSSLKSIEIPRKVQFIDGSAFIGIKQNYVSIESGQKRFAISKKFLVDIIDHRLIRNFSSLSCVTILSDIEIFGSNCFSFCKSLSSISFESNSRLTRIESKAFRRSSLQSIVIPRNVEILGSSCFKWCESFSSISFESNSRLIRIESKAFRYSSLQSIEIPRNVEIIGLLCFSDCKSLLSISFESNSRLKRLESQVFNSVYFSVIVPSTILFIASDAAPDPHHISMADNDSSDEFDRWQHLQGFGIQIDFRRMIRFDWMFTCRSDSLLDLSRLNAGSLLNASDRLSTQIYHWCDDGIALIVKSIKLSVFVERVHLERNIENLMNLRHPCIAGVIGVVFSSPLQELKIVRIYLSCCSLSEIISGSPKWWTPTAKAKAIVGIVLSVQFVHSLGLQHGHLATNNVFFDEDGVIHISDFCMNGFSNLEGHNDAIAGTAGFSRESWTPKADVQGFAGILSEIVIVTSAQQDGRDPAVPTFVSEIIERGQSADSNAVQSFLDIFEILKRNNFKIVEGVDSHEVWSFVNWIESSEVLIE